MKNFSKYFVILIIILNSNSVLGQPVKVGANFILGLPNTITKTGYGIEGIVELKITDKFSGRLSIGSFYSTFEKEGLFDNNLTQTKYNIGVIYRPFNEIENIEPYLGFGLGYYTSTYKSVHNAQVVNGGYVYGVNIDNAVGYNAKIGVNFMPRSKFQVITEFTYTYHKPDYSYTFESPSPLKINDKIDLSNTGFKMFFVFEL